MHAGGSVLRGLFAVCLCAAALALAGCAPTSVELFRGLTELEANRLVAALEVRGIVASKVSEREGVAVFVPKPELARAARFAAQAGLPRDDHPSLGTLFRKDGLISSPLEERARMMFALSQQLEAMLLDIEGVVNARVNVVLPERRPGRAVEVPSAAVLIKHTANVDTDLLQWKVRRLVISSVPGLAEADTRHLSVAFTPADDGRRPAGNGDPTCAEPVEMAQPLPCAEVLRSHWDVGTVITLAAVLTFLAGMGLLLARHPAFITLRNRLRGGAKAAP
jgi:type III secretion protein J